MQATRYMGGITTVDQVNNRIGFVIKGDAQERHALVLTSPIASRWPQVGEHWLVRQENGTWYLDAPLALTSYGGIALGDAVINSPTGRVHVMGSTDGSTDFSFNSVVTTFNNRTGTVTPQSGDYTAAQVSALAITNNLSDLNNSGTARANLGIARGTTVLAFSSATTSSTNIVTHNLGVIPTAVIATAYNAIGTVVPICNTSAYTTTTFSINGVLASSYIGNIAVTWIACA